MNKKISVGFRLNGGVGTYISELNFIEYFFDKFSDSVLITVYGSDNEMINDGLMCGQKFVHSYYERQYYEKDKHDLSIDINWFPKIERAVIEKISLVPELLEVVYAWRSFADDHFTSIYASGDPIYESHIYSYATISGKNRLNVMDIDGLLGIERDLKFKLQTLDDQDTILQNFGLYGKKYITMNSGVNAACKTKESPRQWPLEYYFDLCSMLKEKYPDIILVQLGESEGSEPIAGADLCLLDRTDFDELKVILKNAWLHIDGDCGMVHIRKALHTGPSIALFGQTPANVVGYDDDIVVTSSICKENCAKVFAAWKRKCLRGGKPVCMTEITPKMVLGKIIDYYTTGEVKCWNNGGSSSKNAEILSLKDVSFDPEWAGKWLVNNKIFAYTLTTTALRTLHCAKLFPKGYELVTLEEMPAYHYMIGDKNSYYDYIDLNDTYNPGHEHSVERLENLINKLDNEGYDTANVMVVNGKNLIMDGVHRSCWLLAKYGPDYEVPVLRVYGDFEIWE